MTISFCPPLYPDELMYSFFARYKALAGYRYDTDVQRDFYGARKVAVTTTGYEPIPAETREVLGNWMPSDEVLYRDHSLILVYGAFLKPPTEASNVRVLNGVAINFGSRRFSMINRERVALGMAYCPGCVEQDYEQFGESYWRRSQNLYGAFVCPTHRLHLERVSVHSGRKSEWLRLPPSPEDCSPKRYVNLDDRSEGFLVVLASDLSALLSTAELGGLRDRVASGVKKAVIDSGLDYNKCGPAIKKATNLLSQRLKPDAIGAYHISLSQKHSSSWCEILTGKRMHLEPVSVAVALRVLNSSLPAMLASSNAQCFRSARSDFNVRDQGPAGWGQGLQLERVCWPVDWPPQSRDWSTHKVGTAHERSTRILVGDNKKRGICPKALMRSVKHVVEQLRSEPKCLGLSRIARALGTNTERLTTLMARYPRVAELITEALESNEDYAKRKIRQAVARRLTKGELLTPIEIMHESNTHKWYGRLKPFIIEEIERKTAAYESCDLGDCALSAA